jgi:hypothetical protein
MEREADMNDRERVYCYSLRYPLGVIPKGIEELTGSGEYAVILVE